LRRKWTTPANMPADPYECLQAFEEQGGREQAIQILAEAESVAHNLGGVVFITPRRVKVGPTDDDYATAGYVIVWDSFQRAEQPPPQPQSSEVVEPEPAEVGT
jgi:hypothetical protein